MTAPAFGPVVQVEPAGPAGWLARTSDGFLLYYPRTEGGQVGAPSARGGAPASLGRKAPAPLPACMPWGPAHWPAPLAGELYEEWPPAGMDGQP